MKNWLGQEIEAGCVVYRGARQGDSSSFRIGVVELVREKGTARVKWLWTNSSQGIWRRRQYEYSYMDPEHYVVPGPAQYRYGKGSVDVNTLVKVDDSMLEYLEKRHALIEQARELEIPKSDFAAFERQFMENN